MDVRGERHNYPMPQPQSPPFRGRRPRHPGFRRVHRLTVQLGAPEYDVIREEAERQGLAMGAAVRDFAVLAALQEKGRRGSLELPR